MKIRFLCDITVEVHIGLCCFSGTSRIERRTYKAGDELDVHHVEVGPKARPRMCEVLLDSKIPPNTFTIPYNAIDEL